MKINFKKYAKPFTLDLLFFLLSFVFILLTKLKITSFLIEINSYSPQLEVLQLTQNTEEAYLILQSLNSVVAKAFVFVLLLPVLLFIIYTLTQSFTFSKQKDYFKKFSIFTLVPFVLLLLALFYSSISLFILSFLTYYLTFLLYFKFDKNHLIKLLKKFYLTFPLFLVYVLLIVLILFFLTLSLFAFFNFAFFFIPIIVLILIYLFTIYKQFLIKKLSK
jgi:hypothetical protein